LRGIKEKGYELLLLMGWVGMSQGRKSAFFLRPSGLNFEEVIS